MLHFVNSFWGDFMKILDYFYTESQAAKQLGLNRITIWRWIKAGKLNTQKIGGVVFIPKEQIDSLRKAE
jgi:excisionase family DNA binding protein